MKKIQRYIEEYRSDHIQRFIDFLSIPSVSALSEHRDDMQRAAHWLVSYMKSIGLQKAHIIETDGHPLVYGEYIHDHNAPTALVYGHYDVQPVDPLHLWDTPPFTPTVRDGKMYARGASDDKGQVLMHLRAVESLLATEGTLPVNLRFLIEGEEEVGSVHLGPYIEQQTLEADVIVISDTTMPAVDVPAICCGLRGIAALEIKIRGAQADLHSGLFGGAVPNALHEMARVIASLHDTTGKVNVPGFYDDVVHLQAEERRQLNLGALDDEAFKREAGITHIAGEEGYTVSERIGARPTLELNGMWGGFQGEGTKTVIPSEAYAKITCRLVPDQKPKDIIDSISKALRERLAPGYTLEVTPGHGGMPWFCAPDNPYIQAGLQALETVFSVQPALTRMGGTIPVVETFDRVLGVPIVLMGFALSTDQIHAPNEHFHLETFDRGTVALALYWKELAETVRKVS